MAGFGSAASDLFSGFGAYISSGLKSEGFAAEAANYGMASKLAGENATYAGEAGLAKEVQEKRKQELGIGREVTNIAGNGFTLSGSSLDILRNAHEQAGLETALTQQQTSMNVTGYQEQSAAYKVMQNYALDASKTENTLGTLGLIGGIVGAVTEVGGALMSGGASLAADFAPFSAAGGAAGAGE